MRINVRKARWSDLSAILEIVNHHIGSTTANYSATPENPADREAWFQQKQAENWPVLAAVDENGAVIGFSTYGPFIKKHGYRFTVEHSLYVHPDHQRAGARKLLLLELIRLAKEQGIHVILHAATAGIKQAPAAS